MVNQSSEPALLSILERVIAETPHGLAIAELESKLAAEGLVLNRRTLLRRLKMLVEQNRIAVTGMLKGRRYLPPTATGALDSKTTIDQESVIPLSEAGKFIRRYIRRPVQGREPVGYQRDFLLEYHESGPYLDDTTREHLHRIGRSNQEIMPAATMARQVLGRLLIDFSWASSYLEGNTYSLLETERLISFGQAAEGKNALETQMILNHKQAIEFLVESAEEVGFNKYTILNLHATLADNLLPDPQACGRLRQIAVGIGGSVYTPLTTPQLVEEYFQRVLETAAAIPDPFEQSFFALVHLSYLQPFEDVNKRVARFAANIPLIKNNFCPLSFIDLPKDAYVEGILGVYEMNRIELMRDVYVWGYERSVKRYLSAREEIGEPDPFRLAYRQEFSEITKKIVGDGVTKVDEFLTFWVAAHIPEADRAHFCTMVRRELAALHEGNIARFRIKPSELSNWRALIEAGHKKT
jgi:hypothetical protein